MSPNSLQFHRSINLVHRQLMPFLFWLPLLLFIFLFAALHLTAADAQVLFLNTTTVPSVTFFPSDELAVFRVGDHQNLDLSLWTANSTAWLGQVSIGCEQSIGCPLESPLSTNASVQHLDQTLELDRSNNFTHLFNLSVRGTVVGINRINVLIDGKKVANFAVRTRKTVSGTALTILFTKSLAIAVVVGNFLAGIQLNFDHLSANCLGNLRFIFAAIVCQFFINPIIGFLLANYVLIRQTFVVRLSFFMVTVVPVGVGTSNFWTVLFGGDLQSAAAFLTIIQRLGTILFVPLWTKFVGKNFFVNRVKIGKASVWHACAIVVLPFLIGMLLGWCGLRERLMKTASVFKFLLCACSLLFFAVALLANCAIFWPFLHQQVDLLLCCLLLFPIFAHLCAFFISFYIFQLAPSQRVTLTVENGVPSIGVAMLMLLWSMGEPEKDVAMMAPIGMALLAEKPLLLLCILKICSRIFRKDTVRNGQQQEMVDASSSVKRQTNAKNEQIVKRCKELEETQNEREI